jgi:hypothetical protein
MNECVIGVRADLVVPGDHLLLNKGRPISFNDEHELEIQLKSAQVERGLVEFSHISRCLVLSTVKQDDRYLPFITLSVLTEKQQVTSLQFFPDECTLKIPFHDLTT